MRKMKTEGLSGPRLKLVELANDAGYTMKELSLAIARNHSYLYAYVKRGSPNRLELEDAVKLADVLGCHPGDITEGMGMAPVPSEMVRIHGQVRAGEWVDSTYQFENNDAFMVAKHPDFAGQGQLLLRVIGDSMNELFPDGSLVHCVYIEWLNDVSIDDGDIVVVERRRAGLVETTVKQIKTVDGVRGLWPRSTHKRYKDPILIDDESDTDEVQITAIVLGSYTQLKAINGK